LSPWQGNRSFEKASSRFLRQGVSRMPETPCGPRSEGGQGGQRKPGPQSGPVLAQPAPGWCRPLLRTHATKCFADQTRILLLPRNASMMVSGVILRPPLCRCATAVVPRPLPLRDRCRSAARPFLLSGGEPSTCPALYKRARSARSTWWSALDCCRPARASCPHMLELFHSPSRRSLWRYTSLLTKEDAVAPREASLPY
jgi:hypothetical protein